MVNTYTKTIGVSGIALRTPQEATVGLAVIHGGTAAWPGSFTAFSDNMAIPNATVAPTLSLRADGASSWAAGTYSVSYAWCTTNHLGTVAPTQVGLASPPATITIATDFTEDIVMTAPSPLPAAAGGVAWYVGLVNPSTGAATRYFDVTYPLLSFTDDGSWAWSSQRNSEPTSNTGVTVGLFFGRADDETGNTPVPIPQATPTTVYSYYKAVQAVIPANGFGNTSVSNIAICQATKAPPGLTVFYRVVPAYLQCNGTQGLPTDNVGAQTGNYPPDDLTPHTGTGANTPAGYTPLPTTPVVIANGPYLTSTSGPIGPIVQLVLGVADRATMTQAGGQLSIPQLALYYDET